MRNKLRVITSISSLCLTALLLILSIFGWYTSNTMVSMTGATGGTAEGEAPKYYLGTKGELETTDKVSSFLDFLFGSKNTAKAYKDEDGNDVTLNTTENLSSIRWNLSDSSNLNNTSTHEGIQPSSEGKLDFYVIPTVAAEELSITFSLDLLGYTKPSDSYERVNQTYETYAKHHILFFKEKDDSGIYNDWIDDELSVTLNDVKEGTAYKVTLYWVWPSVLSQVLLQTGNYYLYGRKCILSTTTQSTILNKMESSANSFYYNDGESYTSTEYTNAVADITNLSVDNVSSSFSVDNYKILNSCYNNADQLIGNEIDYLKVSLVSMV